MKTIEGDPKRSDYRIAVILSRFNDFIGEQLLEGVNAYFAEINLDQNKIELIKVPGAFEIPLAAELLAGSKKYDAIIALGAVIKGETPHFDFVSRGVTDGIQQVALNHKTPVIFGVLTTNTIEQANERAGVKSLNKGRDLAVAAIEMADLLNKLS